MNLIKPKKLKQGDTIAIIAPSGVVNKELILNAQNYFITKGYKVKLGKNIFNQNRYLAGTDEERLRDLYSAFEDNSVNAIICARGGYGAIRLANKIDYNIMKNNPKIFCGYSDITALSALFFTKCGLITFSGPMAQSDFASTQVDKYTESGFFNTLTQDYIEILQNSDIIFNPGNAEGILFGGNLATLASLTGVDFIPDKNFILFAEDLNEPVYKIDRYFTQLLNIDKFRNNVSAIILGEFLDIDNINYFNEYFEYLSDKLGIPILGGYPITHAKSKCTVPCGAYAKVENNIIKVSNFTV